VLKFVSDTAPAPGSNFNADTTRNNYAAKLTWRISNNHTVSGTVFGDPNTLEGPVLKTISPPGYQILGAASTFSGTLDTGGTDSTVHYDAVLGPKALFRATFGQHREKQEYGGVGVTSAAFSDRTVVPNANTGGFFTGFDNQTFKRNVYKADFTRVWSAHEVKIGGDFEDISSHLDRYMGGGGQRIYQFQRGGVIYYRHRYFLDPTSDKSDPSTFRMMYPLVTEPRTRNGSFYAQDSFKAASNVTINFGLRWEDQRLYGGGGDVAANLNKSWAPRIGAIWDPMKNGKSKVYFNYGRFYENIPMDINIRSFGGEVTAFVYNFDPNPASILPDPATSLPPVNRRTSFLGGATPVDPNLKGQYIDEYLGGFEYEIAPKTVAGIRIAHRRLGRVIEDFLVDVVNGTYAISNPGEGTYANSAAFYDYTPAPGIKPERKNTSVELTVRRGLSDNWQMLGSYVFAKLTGNYDGVFQNSTGQLDPNINSAYDYVDFLINAKGNLTNDRRHQVKFDGTYSLSSGPLKDLNFGGSFHWLSGSPLTAYGYSFAYANWEYYLTPRGSLGRGPSEWEGDVHLGYPLKLGGSVKANLLLDIFNVFNRQGSIVLDQRYNLDSDAACAGIPDDVCNGDGGLLHNGVSITPVAQLADPRATAANPDFLKKSTLFTLPRSIRFGVRLTF
jgi:hypothetical protein